MTVKTKSAPPIFSNGNGLSLVNPLRWTTDEFQRAYDLGAFGFDDKLELIEGEIIRKMTQNSPHAWTLRTMEKALSRIFTDGYDVRSQLPLVFAPRSKPEPDVAVVVGSINDYKTAHPTTAILIVEILDTTLLMDQTAKAAIYARAQIPEYWIVNLPESIIEVYREPSAMSTQPLGFGYRSLTRLVPGDTLSPLAAPDFQIPVADLLP